MLKNDFSNVLTLIKTIYWSDYWKEKLEYLAIQFGYVGTNETEEEKEIDEE